MQHSVLRHSYSRHALETGVFDNVDSFVSFEDRLRTRAREGITTKEIGDIFEVFVEALLWTDPVLDAQEVWPLSTVPSAILKDLNIGNQDRGIDGIFRLRDGTLGAHQAKFRSERGIITWGELATFAGLSDEASLRLVVTNALDIDDVAANRRNLRAYRFSDLALMSPERMLQVCELVHGVYRPRVRKQRLPHQVSAIRDVTRTLNAEHRATLVMACGTGKTLTALWVAEDLRARRILVLMPSLALIRQCLAQWMTEHTWSAGVRVLCVCSDTTVAENDDVAILPTDMIHPVTTQVDDVRKFLGQATDAQATIVFSTYQSSPVVGEGCPVGFHFDLGVFDEAHRTAGVEGLFSYGLDDAKIPMSKRLFMTATRREFRKLRNQDEIVNCMSDSSIYGPLAHSLSFRKAAESAIICPFKIVISVVTDADIAEKIRDGTVTIGAHKVEADVVASQIALARTMEKYGLRKAFTFHRTVKAARDFAESGTGIKRYLPHPFFAAHVSGSMRTSVRDSRVAELRNADRGLLANARCLTEGVDVPAVDLVAFMSPKESRIDIVQAIGRAMRRAPGTTKTHGFILVPVYLSTGESVEQAVEQAKFGTVFSVLRALMTQDEAFTQEIDQLRITQLRDGAQTYRFDDLLVDGPGVREDDLRTAISTMIIENLGRFDRPADGLPMPDPNAPRKPEVISRDQVIDALEKKFAVKLSRDDRGPLESQNPAQPLKLQLSVSDGIRYEKSNSRFNKIRASQLDADYFVIWSKTRPDGWVIPCTRIRERFARDRFDPLTTMGPVADFMVFDSTYLEVTDFRCNFLNP